MDKRTITVNGFFGEKEITKEEFVQQWSEHMKQIISLSPSLDYARYMAMREEVEKAAGMEFERIWAG